MAITKLQSESLNLADDFTFTGTVAGAGLAEADIKTLFNASGSAPVYACRAWVNFNGTGTVAIRDSGNISSITDNGTGDYTVNFTTAMPDSNYCHVSGAQGVIGIRTSIFSATSFTTSSYRVFAVINATDTLSDEAEMTTAIFR